MQPASVLSQTSPYKVIPSHNVLLSCQGFRNRGMTHLYAGCLQPASSSRAQKVTLPVLNPLYSCSLNIHRLHQLCSLTSICTENVSFHNKQFSLLIIAIGSRYRFVKHHSSNYTHYHMA